MRTLLVWFLLAFAPFTDLRLVCIEGPQTRPAEAVESAPHCDTFCPRPTRDERVRSVVAEMECLFLADGALLMVVADIAVLPAPPVVPFEPRPTAVPPEPDAGYRGPLLIPQPRPPKA